MWASKSSHSPASWPTASGSCCRTAALGRNPQGGSRLPLAYAPGMRIVSPAEAVAGISSCDQLYLHCAAATPSALLEALVARAEELQDVSVVHLHTEGP